ncbi:MAG: hypothetical protein JXM70_24230, partial [Pirellulales bacterium]|nr:hypothetical protein [Pirellulales bacterium]
MRFLTPLALCIIAYIFPAVAGCIASARADTDDTVDELTQHLIGYREYRTNLPSRHANWATMRAFVVNADGTNRRELAHELVQDENTWTAFGGWSPDGHTAIIEKGRNTPENAAWEETHKTFRRSTGWLYDVYLLDMQSGRLVNVSEPQRMSNFNGGARYWPGNPNKLLGNALIDEINHPIIMNTDGTGKQDLISGSAGGFTYSPGISPNGKRIAYHTNYHLYLADGD